MRIDYLQNRQEYIPIVTEWLWKEFGNDGNYRFFESIIKNSLDKDRLPLTFIALDDNNIIGTVGLWRADLVSRQDLYPWLSALYVSEEYRGQGVGKALQKHLLEYCKIKEFNEVYLYTDLKDYYERTGWGYMGDAVEYSGDSIKLYQVKLSSKL